MKEYIISLLHTYESFAYLLSILISILVSILGIVPSVFVTAANLIVFGFAGGTIISFIGEAAGAVVSFLLYRKGFSQLSATKFFSNPKLSRLLNAEGKEAFILIAALRLMPFVPSGAVTFIAAIGKTSLLTFLIASTLGKIPALFLEAYSINHLIQWTWQGKVLSAVIAVFLLLLVWKKRI
ncbi:TVP38/TMEM64 family protein [Metabacillus fastidiosus]|uniref:TVP38/TMEM64 family protein n=1 Tax=Metabacillus fastidiosus TaxID=1458 RepID=UPI003D2B07AB